MKDQKKLSPRERLLNAIGFGEEASLEKALPPRQKPDDDDEDSEQGDGAPSTEDREKAAAPKAPVKEDDGSPDGDDDQDDEDAEPDDDANNATSDDDDQDDDQQAPPQPMPKGKGKPMRKALAESDDDEVLAEVHRRAKDSPDFLKSILDGDDAADILEAIDMSKVVAQIVQSASEHIAAKDIQIATLTKSLESLAAANTSLVEMSDMLCDGLAKSLGQQDTLIKSIDAMQADVELVKSQDNGRVSLGQGTLVAPQRTDPPASRQAAPEEPEGPDRLPEGMSMARLNKALMKSIEEGVLTREQGKRHMDSVGNNPAQNQRVWKKLPEPVRELALATK
jgi:hypothetical protein